MTQPTPYIPAYSFTGFQRANQTKPLPGDKIDANNLLIKDTLDEILANLALIQRDDGEVANQTIGYEQLKPELATGIAPAEAWETDTAYAVGDAVFYEAKLYRCLVAHTSGVFATDLAADKWLLVSDFTDRSAFLTPNAVGDGVADDTVAIQTAMDLSAALGMPLLATKTYRITAPLIVPSYLSVDGLGTGKFVKDYNSVLSTKDAMFRNENYGVLTPGGDVFDVKFSRLTITNAPNKTGAMMTLNNITGLLLDNITAIRTTGGQGFTILISGENVEIISPTIHTADGIADALHFNYVKNLTITNPNIYAYDDCIAFTADPPSYLSQGPLLPGENIVILGGTLRSKLANGIRISNGYNLVAPNDVAPGQVFKRIRVIGTIFERDDAAGNFVALSDLRTNATDKHDDIEFHGCLFRGREPDAVRCVWLQGNANPFTSTVKNYGYIGFYNCVFECGTGEIFGGGSASGQMGGGFEKLIVMGGRVKRLAATAADHGFDLQEFGLFKVGGGLLFEDNASGVAGFRLRSFDRVEIGDVTYSNDHASGTATAAVLLDDPNSNAVLISSGLIAQGDVQQRIGVVSAITLGRAEISGGSAETTVNDISGNLSADVIAVPARTIGRSATALSHSGDTTETTLATVILPANCMGKKGRVIISGVWSYPNSANTKTVRVKFGGTNYYFQGPTTNAGRRFQIEISNRDANDSQIGGPNSDGFSTGSPITSSVDTTAAVTILFTAQLDAGGASAGEVITLESYKVVLERSG